MVNNLPLKIANKIKKVLPIMFNCEANYLQRLVETDSSGAEEISFVNQGKIQGLHIGKGDASLVPDITGDKEWNQISYVFYCITDIDIKLRDKIEVNNLSLSVVSLWKFENINIVGLGDEL